MEKIRILIVEDDEISRDLLVRILEPFAQCDIAANGTEALDSFKIAVENGNFYDLICLDIMMPIVDGSEVLKKIRLLEQKMQIPNDQIVKIIMTTAVDNPKDIIDSFSNQCDAYIIKPIDVKQIAKYLVNLGLIGRDKIYEKLGI